MIKYLPFLLYLWLIAFFQVVLKDMTSIYGVSINLPMLLVMLVAVYKSELTAIWFGLFVGLTAYAGSGFNFGYQVFIFCAFAFIGFHLKERLNLESLFARLLLVIGGVFTHNLIMILFETPDNFIVNLFVAALPGAIYSTIIAWFFFMVKEERITYKKFKSIF